MQKTHSLNDITVPFFYISGVTLTFVIRDEERSKFKPKNASIAMNRMAPSIRVTTFNICLHCLHCMPVG